ncbi:MAG: TlpA disulfide reductase family protein [Bacteroidota bacterium]
MAFNRLFILLLSFLVIAGVTMACSQDDGKNETEAERNNLQGEDLAVDDEYSTESVDIAVAPDKGADNVFEITGATASGSQSVPPNFTWNEDGKTMNFSDYTKGKVVFLNFWGTWCPPCRAEIPDIIRIAKEEDPDNVMVIGIALERSNNQMQTVSNYVESKDIPYPIFVDTEQALYKAIAGISSVPTTLIIDKEGSVVEVILGAKSYERFMQSINRVKKS